MNKKSKCSKCGNIKWKRKNEDNYICFKCRQMENPKKEKRKTVYGEWKQIHTYQTESKVAVVSEAQCTKCGKYSAQMSVEGLVTYEFCPRCGEKMREVKE